MADDGGLEGAMKPGNSGTRSVRWRVLLAHDGNAKTCDQLADAILGALGNVEILDAASVQGGAAVLEPQTGQTRAESIDVCFVCLDLAPAPTGGARLAEIAIALDVPVVLVTRSQRWIPQQNPKLKNLPWITPSATASEIGDAVTEAMATQGHSATWSIEEREVIRDSVA